MSDSQLTIYVYEADPNGNPTGSPLTSALIVNSDSAVTQGFKSVEINPPLSIDVSINKEYCLVVSENVPDGDFPSFEWYGSSVSNPNNKTFKGIVDVVNNALPSNWTKLEERDFYYKIYYNAIPIPISETQTIDFTDGDYRGCIVNDNGELVTDTKIAGTFIVDDTSSFEQSLTLETKKDNIKILMNAILDRTLESHDVSKSYFDFWIYANETKERTDGFTNVSAALMGSAEALYNNGEKSDLYSSVQQAIVSMNPQSLIDAVIKEGRDNSSYVEDIVNYLDDKNLLRLADIVAANTNTQWDGQISTIPNYPEPSLIAVERWAKSFTPFIVVISDGDYISKNGDVVITANNLWDDNGVPVMCFGVGNEQNQDGLREIANETNGNHFILSNTQDWVSATASLMHGGKKCIFNASWSKNYDFNEPIWVKNVIAEAIVPQGYTVNPECVVKARYTKDRIKWTHWHIVNNDKLPFIINDLIMGLEIDIQTKDGWNGAASISPTVKSVKYTKVTPSRKYLVTQSNQNNGMILEYLLSATISLPRTARISWGIVRGDSVDFADYDVAVNGRKSVLPNRQYGIKFMPSVARERLTTRTVDLQTYFVYEEDGTPARWADSDNITVYVEDIVPQSSTYSSDGNNGVIYFGAPLLSNLAITVTVETPSYVVFYDGEATYTRDYRTYYLSNGRWTKDSISIVLINGNIIRGGYWTSPDDGTITFDNERETTDIVSVYIQHNPYYRVGLEILNYDETQPNVELQNLGLYFTEVTNSTLVNNYLNSPIPTLISVPQIVCNGNSVFSRMVVEYTFNSVQNAREKNSLITWWRVRNGVVEEIVDYKNRITEKVSDIGAIENTSKFKNGDEMYVQVTPSDGINVGQVYESPHIVLTADNIPVAWEPIIVCPEISAANRNVIASNTDNSFVTTDDHGFALNEPIGFAAIVFPGGVKSNTMYYTIPDATNLKKFRIATQINGSVLDVTTNGLTVKVFKYATYVPVTASLEATYQFSGGVDKSLVEWYLNDNNTTIFATGKTIASGTLVAGQSLSFMVTPKIEVERNGGVVEITGYPILSSSVEVVNI